MPGIPPEPAFDDMPLVQWILLEVLQLLVPHGLEVKAQDPDQRSDQHPKVQGLVRDGQRVGIGVGDHCHKHGLQHVDLQERPGHDPFPPLPAPVGIPEVLSFSPVAAEQMIKEPKAPGGHQCQQKQGDRVPVAIVKQGSPAYDHKAQAPAKVDHRVVLHCGAQDKKSHKVKKNHEP